MDIATEAPATPGTVRRVSVGDDGALNTDLSEPLHMVWIDRDISWLDFNERVLAEALDERNPLLERVKFLAIVTSNADEFFMKRISLLRDRPDPATGELSRQFQIKLIQALSVQAHCWKHQIMPLLGANGIHLLRWQDLSVAQREEANAYFDHVVFPALTPLIMSAGERFPFLSNLSTSLVFPLHDPRTGASYYARVKKPGNLPAWLPLKADVASEQQALLRLYDLIEANLSKLYEGMIIGRSALVRITRDAEVEEAENQSSSTPDEVRRQLRQRRFEPVVRLEFSTGADPATRELLVSHFRLQPEDVYDAPDDLDCSTLFELSSLSFSELRDKPWTPVTPPMLRENGDLFAAIRSGDFLVHHPYESFDVSVSRFIDQAAADPLVIVIKMTVYRVGDDTPFVRSLIKAAESGKQVACVIELKARFDEERNLHWAEALEKAGAHVTFGVSGLKTHGKCALVVRKEEGTLRCYAHIGTGNYHNRTARLYSDLGFFTCDPVTTRDVVSLFHHLTGHSEAPVFARLLVAPKAMRSRLLELMEREIENAKSGLPARIVVKMNQLEDPEIIAALCQASSAGVSIELIIRGFCCLRPGVPGVSENIRVRSIIGRFLEHSRIFFFANGASDLIDGDMFIGSADWMFRNLSKRIEVVTPVIETSAKRRLAHILQLCLDERRQSWHLSSDGHYRRASADSTAETQQGAEECGMHEKLMNLANTDATA